MRLMKYVLCCVQLLLFDRSALYIESMESIERFTKYHFIVYVLLAGLMLFSFIQLLYVFNAGKDRVEARAEELKTSVERHE